MANELLIADVIRVRSSWRSYDGRPLEPGDRARLEDFIAALEPGPFGGRVRLELVEASPGDRAELRALGTYGAVKRARTFLAGAIKQRPMDMEDYGYVFERAVLFATALGLGTCWLGASFNRSGFASKINLARGEILPAVSPVGYVASRRTAVDAVTRFFARAKRRKPWEKLFFDGAFGRPLSREAAGPYAEVLAMVRLAPSASNRQPWRIVKEAGRDVFHLFISRSAVYSGVATSVAGGDLQRLDMGIACCHFGLTARELGLPGKWERLEPPALKLPERTSYVATWRGR
ncbi:MAG: nitroreductase [candidate division Zixibacteria bacterium]|nr:nitroreductase [candidate division Zixibacteria bacterium]